MRGLAESLELVTPSLAPELVSAATVGALTNLAQSLPPIHRAGFECRLRAGDQRVDFQQGIPRGDEEPARLVACSERREAAWERIYRFAQRWAAPGDVVHRAVSHLWLEFDLLGSNDSRGASSVPSVFAVLDPAARDQALGDIPAVLGTLVGEREVASLASVVARLCHACRGRAWVSHIGVMLGRPVSAVRIHVNDIALRDLGNFLQRINWSGDAAEVEWAAQLLFDHGDYVVLCLDILGELTSSAGLECFFAQQHGVDPRWRPLLERLTGLGLCAPDKAKALLQWPGRITPVDDLGRWPGDLIVQSLTRESDVFGVIERRLSHIKLICTPGAPVSAKGYFGYGHLWMSRQRSSPRPVRRRIIHPASTAELAIAAAVAGLLEMRNQGGWWRDFFDRARPADADRRVTGYASDEWVTAFVAYALSTVPIPDARDAAGDALALLLARRHRLAGWGYHALLPADADTTTWVLRLARSLGKPEEERLGAGRRLIESLTGPDGGVATYLSDAAVPLARFLRMDGSYAGWCSPHTCVTAAAAVLEIVPATTAYLIAAQAPDGSWAGHWWDDDEYTTARAVEALAGSSTHAAAVGDAVAWCSDRIGPDGAVWSAAHGGPSPFATALALHAIRIGGSPPDRARWGPSAERAERWLLSHQLDDGSWEPSARLRVPAPKAPDPDAAPELTLSYVDDEAAFTTATVLAALSASRSSPR